MTSQIKLSPTCSKKLDAITTSLKALASPSDNAPSGQITCEDSVTAIQGQCPSYLKHSNVDNTYSFVKSFIGCIYLHNGENFLSMCDSLGSYGQIEDCTKACEILTGETASADL